MFMLLNEIATLYTNGNATTSSTTTAVGPSSASRNSRCPQSAGGLRFGVPMDVACIAIASLGAFSMGRVG